MMVRVCTLLCFSFLFINSIFAQLPDGSIAQDFTVIDIDGNTHNLYDILDQGKSVVLDLSATWCGPCWNYHQTQRLENLYEDYGPDGTDEIEIFMLEADFNTNTNCLYGPSGCNSSTWGDWTAGVTYPIVNLTSSNGGSIPVDYALNYYPTLYKICPNRKVYEVGQANLQTWINWVSSCNLDATEEVTNGICFGDGLGGIDLTPEGGYGSRNYMWSNGATTEDLVDPGNGSYSCTITDSYGHSIEIGPFDVVGPSSPLVANLDLTGDVNCNGENNGFINTSVFGGEPVYQFQWDNGQNTEDITNLGGGSYMLTVTDDLGCTETISTIINEPPPLTMSSSTIEATCGEDNGSILLFAGGGTGQYTYDIGNGPSSSNIFQNLEPGFYTTYLTDENNCVLTEIIEVESVPEPVAEAGVTGELGCNEVSIQLDGTGSSNGNNFIYQWTTDDGNILDGEDTATPTVDEEGTYTLTVIDVVNNCQDVDEVTVEVDGDAPVADAGDDSVLNCTFSTVELDGSNSASGDTIAYEWINENNEVISTELIAETDTAGVYQLIVTNTETGCSSVASVEVTENLDTPIADTGEAGELTCAVTSVLLDGSGSTSGANITYEWLDANDNIVGSEDSLDVDEAGVYRLFVTNSESTCVSIDTVEVLENIDAPVSNAGEDDELNCETTSIILDGSGSSAGNNITYEWLDENDTVVSTEDSLLTDAPGTYRLIVTDAENGCTDESEVIITENVETPVSDAGEGDELNCDITLVTLDGSNSTSGSNILYEWLDEDDNVLGNNVTLDTEESGTYRLVVTNTESECSDESEVVVTLNEDTPNSEVEDADILNCIVSSITLDGSNSSSGANITYEWLDENGDVVGDENMLETSVPGTYTLKVTNTESACTDEVVIEVEEDTVSPIADSGDNGELNCNISSVTLDGSNSSSGNNISYIWTNEDEDVVGTEAVIDTETPGTYTLIVTNENNGCTDSATSEVLENLDTPNADAGEGSELTCVVSQVILDGSGSSTGNNISYEWQDEESNTIATTLIVDVSTEGEYILIVTNNDSECTSTSSVMITASNAFPDAVVNNPGELNCNNVQVTLDGSESSTGPNYSYEWLNSNGEVLGEEIMLEVSIAGAYTLVVSDTENGCTASTDILLEQNTEQPDAVIEETNGFNCINQTVTLNGLLSTGENLDYEWFNSANTQIGNEGEVEVSEVGSYTLEVTNLNNGCTDTETIEVLSDTESPIATASTQGILNCINENIGIDGDGSSTGNEFDYQWTGGNIIEGENLLNPIVNQAGVYTLVITNTENGCTTSTQVEVMEDIEVPTADAGPTNALHCNLTNIDLDGTNSAIGPDFNYSWSTNDGNIVSGENSMTPTIDASGVYELVVTNSSNGCSSTSAVEITAIPEIEIQLETVSHVGCFGGSDGVINLIASGGLAPLNYEWSNGSVTEEIENLSSGTYQVTVTDQNGCSTIDQITIDQPNDLEINLTIANESSLNGNNGEASVLPTGGNGGYTYLWSTGSTAPNITNLSPGIYSVTITDVNGCSTTESFTVEEFSCTLTSFIEENQISCFGETDGTATVFSSAESGVTYLWNTGATTSIISNLQAGIYFVTVIDVNNCEVVSQVEIIEPQQLEASITDEVNVQCATSENGSATAQVAGGTGAYTYAWSNGETSQTAEMLSSGDYSVTIFDENGCSITWFGTIEAIDDVPPTVITQDITVPLDADGFAVFNALMIDNGSFDNCGLSNISLDQTVFDCNQLGLQTVTLTLTDLSGNESSGTAEVLVVDNIAPVITCSPDIMSNSCSVVEYDLPEAMDNCSVTLELIEGLPSGEEFSEGVTIIAYQATDNAGNSVTCSFTVTVEYDFSSTIEVSPVACHGSANGMAIVTPSGGTAGYIYQWSNGQTGMSAENLTSGDYSVVVTDATGCTSEHLFEISEPDPVSFVVDEIIDELEGTSNGSVQVSVSGGTAPYSYTWFFDNNVVSNEEDLTNAVEGQYQLIITDANGCELVSEAITVGSITSSHELDLAQYIKVMPNPTNGNTFVHIELPTDQEIDLNLFDVSGKHLFSVQRESIMNDVIEVDLSGYANGIYLLHISTSEAVFVEKIALKRF